MYAPLLLQPCNPKKSSLCSKAYSNKLLAFLLFLLLFIKLNGVFTFILTIFVIGKDKNESTLEKNENKRNVQCLVPSADRVHSAQWFIRPLHFVIRFSYKGNEQSLKWAQLCLIPLRITDLLEYTWPNYIGIRPSWLMKDGGKPIHLWNVDESLIYPQNVHAEARINDKRCLTRITTLSCWTKTWWRCRLKNPKVHSRTLNLLQ